MDPITITALVVGALALLGVGHFSGTWAAAAKAKAAQIAQTAVQDVGKVQAWGTGVESALSSFAHHPIDTIEAGLAQHHASSAITALDNLIKSAKAKADDLAAHNKVIEDVKAKIDALMQAPR